MPWKGHLKLSICHFEQMVYQQQVKHWWKYRTRWHTVALTYILRWILAKALRSVWECKCTASCGGELRTGDWPRYRGKLWGRSFLSHCWSLTYRPQLNECAVHWKEQMTADSWWSTFNYKRCNVGLTINNNQKKIEHYCLKIWKQSTLFKWKL